MQIEQEISQYISTLPQQKRTDIQAMHEIVLSNFPKIKLWYLDGRDEKGKVVTNPNIGYGIQTLTYANGKSKEFYKLGLSANTSGISIYIIGIEDKSYLKQRFGDKLNKAKITGYCIQLKSMKDVDFAILEEVFRYGLERK